MRRVLAIAGGSSPFTAALVEALRGIAPCELRLHGRDMRALERMRRYAERRLQWPVLATTRLTEAVDGAEVVVNQIRFGGLEGRARDEELAWLWRLPADETLGPCGLSAALRVAPPLRALAAELGRRCPDAWLLNLSNPLSATTLAMIRAGAPRNCVGLCELPLVTVLEVCRAIGMSPADVEWDYAGLNHRGLIFSLRHKGEELIPRLPELLEGQEVFGVRGADIEALGALPLKYFRLGTQPGRADFLRQLRERLASELETPNAPPPSLARRSQPWYQAAVVPMIAAILAGDGHAVMVNCERDGLVREVRARVFRDRFEPVDVEPPPRLAGWLDRWGSHEKALVDAVESPSLEGLERALTLDPLVPSGQAREIARALWVEHAS